MEIKLAKRSLYNLLEIAAEKREPIITKMKHRGLGKTKALIEFARDNDYVVLVGSTRIAKMLIKEYGYRQIKSIKSNLDGCSWFVFDECCSEDDVNKLLKQRLFVLTGFMKEKTFYQNVEN